VGRTGARQAGDDDRGPHLLGRDLRVELAVVHQPQPLDQGGQQQVFRDLGHPPRRVARLVAQRPQQDVDPLEEWQVAEVSKSRSFRGQLEQPGGLGPGGRPRE
jgi:hypothetical protein